MLAEGIEAAENTTLIRVLATKKLGEISWRKSNSSDGELVKWPTDVNKKHADGPVSQSP